MTPLTMYQSLSTLFKRSLALYSLFLLPTLLLLLFQGNSDASISRAIGETWQAQFWHFPGLNELSSRVTLDLLQAVAVGLSGWLFYQGFKVIQTANKDVSGRMVIQWSLFAGLLLVFSTTFHSSDLYGYLNRGFQQSVFHTNPYLTTIAEVPHWQNSALLHDHWIDNPCPYGFFFAQLIHWLTLAANERFWLAYLLFKGLNLLLFTGSTLLIAHLGKKNNLSKPWLAAYLFGANPLVLLHTMGNGHNDIVMVFLLLLSVACLQSQRWQWLCLPVLTLSILTKYASLLVLPLVVIYGIKQRKYQPLWVGALLSMGLVATLASPYVAMDQPWPWNALLDNAGKAQHSIIRMLEELVYYPLKWLHLPGRNAAEAISEILKPIFWSGFVLFYGWRCLQLFLNKTSVGCLLYEIALTSTVMVAFISAKFHPWYVVMFLPLALLLPEQSRLRQFALIMALFQLAGFTIFQNLPVISVVVLTLLPAWLAYRRHSLFREGSA